MEKGFTQDYGIVYKETFSHVARTISVHALFAFVTTRQWKLTKIYVKSSFLNDELEEKFYTRPPL